MIKRIYRVWLPACLIAATVAPSVAEQAPSHPAILVDVNALTAESDFTVFLRKDVPEEVRRAALRRLWVIMKLPVSCDELCHEPNPAASGVALLSSGQASIPTE
jgi:hypothetical protein